MALVGRWRLDERQSGRYHDVSGQGNDGFPASLPGGAPPSVEPTVPAPDGICPGFDERAFIVVPRGGVDRWILEQERLTVEACVLAEKSPGTYRYVVAKGANEAQHASYALYTGGDGGLQFYVAHQLGQVTLTTPSINIWDGRWHHIAGTFGRGALTLWVDGEKVASAVAPSTVIRYGLPTHNDLTIGNYLTSPDANGIPGFGFIGRIDEVRIWLGALDFS